MIADRLGTVHSVRTSASRLQHFPVSDIAWPPAVSACASFHCAQRLVHKFLFPETLVNPAHFQGTVYRPSNRIDVGRTLDVARGELSKSLTKIRSIPLESTDGLRRHPRTNLQKVDGGACFSDGAIIGDNQKEDSSGHKCREPDDGAAGDGHPKGLGHIGSVGVQSQPIESNWPCCGKRNYRFLMGPT